MARSMIAILDLGSTENAAIAREIRALGMYSEIFAHDIEPEALKNLPGVCGVIVNGGENNVVDGEKIDVNPGIYSIGLPVLTACHQGAHANDYDVWPENREKALDAFIEKTASPRDWTIENFIEEEVALLRKQIGNKKVLLALSGGVDSSVVAAMLIKAVGDQLTCVHVNHGLLRKGEPEQVVNVFGKELGANLVYVDAVDRFLDKLAGVADPEQKRKIIGAEFIRVFEEEARKLEGIAFLGQGTIYPDIIESGTKTAKMVKSHHNVGGLPEDLQFELVEPLKMLFKDEVRACGEALGLPHDMVYRQPFPGPGLGVRCLGAITRDRLEAVRESDAILREEFAKNGLQGKVWQYFTAIPDLKSVGVRNHARADEWAVIIRAVNTVDAMTATVEELDWNLIHTLTKRITNEVKGVNRVLIDVTPKPTGTIEWE
ncbi:MAG: glutamine-hydrolyzing GMP synthase [Clostridia bacterium]|nr:glutamine-hydrolyzing GMP synthase [Clostridia bacterium]